MRRGGGARRGPARSGSRPTGPRSPERATGRSSLPSGTLRASWPASRTAERRRSQQCAYLAQCGHPRAAIRADPGPHPRPPRPAQLPADAAATRPGPPPAARQPTSSSHETGPERKSRQRRPLLSCNPPPRPRLAKAGYHTPRIDETPQRPARRVTDPRRTRNYVPPGQGKLPIDLQRIVGARRDLGSRVA
jgi:hypothetical protein